ncbi:MAG: LLM class flavin-dependent oxidoreductase [Candidatus Jordarchaeaceae archaeon]
MIKLSVALPQDANIHELMRLAKIAECEGYSSIFVTDEGLSRNSYVVLASCALATKRISLGTGVTNPYIINPVITAAAMATVDELSGGRVFIGLGAGSLWYLEMFGLHQRKVLSTLDRTVDILRRLFNGEHITTKLSNFKLQNVKLAFPSRKIPIYIGGRGPKILRLAGKIADGVIAGGGLVSGNKIGYVMHNVEEGAKEAGRDIDTIDIVLWAFCSIADENSIARAPLRPLIAEIIHGISDSVLSEIGIKSEPVKNIRMMHDYVNTNLYKEQQSSVSDEILDKFCIAGTPKYCLKKIRELVRAGVRHLAILPIENPQKRFEAIIRQFHDLACEI